ncbi:MAG: rRNA maturation RNase YbeY [Rickettsiales bacterium]
MNSKVDLDCEFKDKRWKRYSKAFFIKIFNTCIASLPKEKNSLDFTLSLIFASGEEVCDLNHKYRQKNKDTNVLSFQYVDWNEKLVDRLFLGDVVFSYDTVLSEAKEKKLPFDNYLSFLFIHALLHLFGYDHQNSIDAKKMEMLENRIYKDLNLDA